MAKGDILPVLMGGDKGIPHGVPSLDGGGKIPVSQLPPAVSGENLLDNSCFIHPINQRGISGVFSSVGQYFIDRWILLNGTVELTPDGLRLNGTMLQKREHSVGMQTFASVKMSSGTAAATYDDVLKRFEITSSGGVICGAKLEIGDVSTIDNDAPSNMAVELQKCQRYYEKMANVSAAGSANPSGYFRFWLPFKSTKAKANSSVKVISVHGAAGQISYFNGSVWLDVPATTIANADGVIVEATDKALINAAIMFSVEGSGDL